LLAVGSCTAVLDVGEYNNVAEELCTLLDRCSATSIQVQCQSSFEQQLNTATSEVRTDWLSSFTSYRCLDSCTAGRHCLDTEPLCHVTGACSAREDCCGSLSGHADCKGKEPRCCTTRGSGCDTDADCCAGAGACDPVVHTCGGTHCLDGAEACQSDAECCTRICKDGACSTTTCNEDKFECSDDDDCCGHHCDQVSHLCAPIPTCKTPTQPCSFTTDCCDGLSCAFEPGSIQGQCTAAECKIADLECATDDQCCSGHCNTPFFFCAAACVFEGSACAADLDCCAGACQSGVCAGTCSKLFCTQSSDCCSNSCISGLCAAECKPPSMHTPCKVGGPLVPTEESAACLDAVCELDPFCCCGAWDELCVASAAKQGSACSMLCL
jgi:hypothetical protein